MALRLPLASVYTILIAIGKIRDEEEEEGFPKAIIYVRNDGEETDHERWRREANAVLTKDRLDWESELNSSELATHATGGESTQFVYIERFCNALKASRGVELINFKEARKKICEQRGV